MHVAILHRTRECNTHHFELHDGGWKKEAGGGGARESSCRQSCRNVDAFSTPSMSLCREGGPLKIQAPRPAVIFANGQYSEGRGEWNFHLT